MPMHDTSAQPTWQRPFEAAKVPPTFALIRTHAWGILREVAFYYGVLMACSGAAYALTRSVRAACLPLAAAPFVILALLFSQISDLRDGEHRST